VLFNLFTFEVCSVTFVERTSDQLLLECTLRSALQSFDCCSVLADSDRTLTSSNCQNLLCKSSSVSDQDNVNQSQLGKTMSLEADQQNTMNKNDGDTIAESKDVKFVCGKIKMKVLNFCHCVNFMLFDAFVLILFVTGAK
jgi:hypothetical protein